MTKQRRYRLNRFYDQQFRWKVRRLRKNRWQPRVLRRQDLDAAVAADEESAAADEEDDSGSSTSSSSSASSSGSSSTASSSASTDSDDSMSTSGSSTDESGTEDEGSSTGSSSGEDDANSSDESVAPIGRAADGSSDAVKEAVLFVQSISRASGDVDRQGRRLAQKQWFQVVPKTRVKVKALLQSMWHAAGGEQMVSARRLYARVADRYVGVSIADVKAFVLGQEAVQLGRNNTISDAIVAPSLPQRTGDAWQADITYLDSTIPSSGGYVGFLTVVDGLSKWALTAAVKDKAASTVAAALDQLMTTNGAPKLLIQDSARENKSNAVKLVAARHGVKLRFTKPHSSQENGMVERAHQTLKALLRRLQLDLAKAGRSLPLPDLLGRYRHIQLQRTQRHAYGALGSLLRPSATEDTAAFAARRSA